MMDNFWPVGLGVPKTQTALQRRTEDAKVARLDAQEKLLGLFPEAVAYLRMVLVGQVAPDPDRLRVALKLADKILPNLQAVAVQGQVLGVDQEDTGKQSQHVNAWLNVMASVSADLSKEEEAGRQRRKLEAQGASCHDGAQSPAVVQPEAAPDSSQGWKLPQGGDIEGELV